MKIQRVRAGFALIASLLLSGACAVAPSSTDLAGSSKHPELYSIAAAADRAYQQGLWLEAARHYEALTRLLPHEGTAWFRIGNIRMRQGDPQRAISAYQRALQHDASQPRSWFNLSTAYLLQADQAMRQALSRMNPEDPARRATAERLRVLNALLAPRLEEDRLAQTSHTRF